jgi:methionyl-tRNA formyltransferase
MTNSTKVIFFGTSDRSVPILESLKANFDLVLCVTKEDVLVGRHQTLKEVEVKKWAKANGVNFVTIRESLNKENETIIEQIRSSKAEVGVVADFGYIIPQEILAVFPKGLINIHFSLLPKYRGASPVQFAILNGDPQTGVTFQLMQYALDTGPIIHQLPYPLAGTETTGELYRTLFNLSAQHLPVVLQNYLDGKITSKPQDEGLASYTYSPSHPKNTYIYREDAKLNWNAPVKKLDAMVRTFNPWPIAWTTLGDMREAQDKIVGFTELKDPNHASKVAKIHSAQLSLDGRLGISQIQLEGGKTLLWEQFKNGYLA